MPVSTGQQREVSPIPPGRYWLIINGGGNMRDFNDWLRDMHGAAVVETSSLDQSVSPPSQFVIFHVPPGRMPFLNAPQFGFPNFAPPEVTSVQDVIQNEQHENSEDVIVDVVRRAEQGAANAAEGLGGLFVVAMLFLLMGAGSSFFAKH
jgi:hypothetical protein